MLLVNRARIASLTSFTLAGDAGAGGRGYLHTKRTVERQSGRDGGASRERERELHPRSALAPSAVHNRNAHCHRGVATRQRRHDRDPTHWKGWAGGTREPRHRVTGPMSRVISLYHALEKAVFRAVRSPANLQHHTRKRRV